VPGSNRTPLEANKIIQGLWIGSELSVMEQLSISSFLLNAHNYHLYVYDDLKYIPVGKINHRGREVVNGGVIKTPTGSVGMAYAGKFVRRKIQRVWFGAKLAHELMAKAIKRFGLGRYHKTHQTFCPVASRISRPKARVTGLKFLPSEPRTHRHALRTLDFIGAPAGIRTPNQQIMSLLL
jgi:hypothetical protein